MGRQSYLLTYFYLLTLYKKKVPVAFWILQFTAIKWLLDTLNTINEKKTKDKKQKGVGNFNSIFFLSNEVINEQYQELVIIL